MKISSCILLWEQQSLYWPWTKLQSWLIASQIDFQTPGTWELNLTQTFARTPPSGDQRQVQKNIVSRNGYFSHGSQRFSKICFGICHKMNGPEHVVIILQGYRIVHIFTGSSEFMIYCIFYKQKNWLGLITWILIVLLQGPVGSEHAFLNVIFPYSKKATISRPTTAIHKLFRL